MSAAKKTNAMRLLDSAQIDYAVRTYEFDEDDLSGVHAADKAVELLHVKELLPVTGYSRGGCSPIGMKKKFPTYFDETAMLFDEIAVSAGQRGVQLIVNPDALAAFVEADYVDLTA